MPSAADGGRQPGSQMDFNANVFDVWVFRRGPAGVEYLVLHTSPAKADRHFAGGRYWQVPCEVFGAGETALAGIDRLLARFGIRARAVWAAEHAYTIYNRRFEAVQLITVFAVEVDPDAEQVTLDPIEHAEHAWVSFEEAMRRVHYRGLKDGLRSTREYITGAADPAAELRLR